MNMKFREQRGVLVPERELLVPDKRLCTISMFPFDHGILSAVAAAAGPAWTNMNATQFALGNTASFDWTGSNVDPNTTDANIRTALTLVSASQDFDFRATLSATPGNGPAWGFYTTGTTDGDYRPSVTDPIVYARNGSGSADIGWLHDDANLEGAAKSSDWMSLKIIQFSRRGSTFYGLIDDVLDRTYSETTGTNAGGFFIGCTGGGAVWQANSVQYRLGPGLPAIS